MKKPLLKIVLMLMVCVSLLNCSLYFVSCQTENTVTIDDFDCLSWVSVKNSSINQKVVYDQANYIYVTEYGNYTWLQPSYILVFDDITGLNVIEKSQFILQENSTGAWLPQLKYENLDIHTHTDFLYGVSWDITDKHKGTWYIIGSVNLSMDFNQDKPKISIEFVKNVENWNLLSKGSFRWIWDIIPNTQKGWKYYSNHETEENLDITQITELQDLGFFSEILFTNNEQYVLSSDRIWCSLNTSDVGTVLYQAGKEPYWNSHGFVVVFPIDQGHIDPNTVVTTNDVSTYYPWQRKVLRTSDGSIHVLVKRAGYITHYYSYNEGQSWSNHDVWSIADSCSFDLDSNDNLIAVRAKGSYVYFKKATVTKGTPWTWSWGTEKTVDSSGTDHYYPDVCVDDNDYYHVVYERTGGVTEWARCTDGTGDSWTVTILSGFWTYTPAGIVHDSNNHLYVAACDTGKNRKVTAVKITYTASPESWSIGTYYAVSSASSYPPSICITQDEYIVVSYSMSTSNLYFRKSTNPSDVSSWGTEKNIESSQVMGQYDHSLAIASSTLYRIYYAGSYVNANGDIFYKESSDSGSSWGARSNITDDNLGNRYPMLSKTVYDSKLDYIWRNGTSNPYSVLHDIWGLLQEFSYEFTETCTPTSTIFFEKEIMFDFQEIAYPLETFVFQKEIGFNLVETANPLANLVFLRESSFIFTETNNPLVNMMMYKEIMFDFQEIASMIATMDFAKEVSYIFVFVQTCIPKAFMYPSFRKIEVPVDLSIIALVIASLALAIASMKRKS